MKDLLILRTGLYDDEQEIIQAVAQGDYQHIDNVALDVESMSDQDWDEVVKKILACDQLLTV